MEDVLVPTEKPARRPPWNKAKIVGAKPQLRPSHVWSIWTKLQMEGRKRDLALFNLAIDSKLRRADACYQSSGSPAPALGKINPGGYDFSARNSLRRAS
jgi:hypothetical protein